MEKKYLNLTMPDVVNRNPYIKKQSASEKFLRIPHDMTEEYLNEDEKLGAVQFSELKSDKSESYRECYIIHTDNIEFGQMAVMYHFASHFNGDRCGTGCYLSSDKDKDDEFDTDMFKDIDEDDEFDTDIFEETDENKNYDLYMPLIDEHEFWSFGGSNNLHNIFNDPLNPMLGESKLNLPSWIRLQYDYVCIVSDNNQPSHFAPMGSINNKLSELLRKTFPESTIYIIAKHRKEPNEDNNDNELFVHPIWAYDGFGRGNLDDVVLEFAAKEISCYLKEDDQRKYYAEVFKSNLKKRNISFSRNLSFDRLANIVIQMTEPNKCKRIDRIVNYIIKIKGEDIKKALVTEDFRFIERFGGIRLENIGEDKGKEKKEKLTALERMMRDLVGMDNVKSNVNNIILNMKYQALRSKFFPSNKSRNVVLMVGAPGTAKSTVGKYLGEIMFEEKLLPDNRFTSLNGAELKGAYVGHTAPKVHNLFMNYDIIFIDEAYSLVNGADNDRDDSFSKEAMAQLMIELEEHSQDKLVIFAGYGGTSTDAKSNKMRAFIAANPGLQSRISYTISFEQYSPAEMLNIFLKHAELQEYIVEEGAKELIIDHFSKRRNSDNFGNGREARSLLEKTVTFMAVRMMEKTSKPVKEDMRNILLSDVKAAIKAAEDDHYAQEGNVIKEKKIGFSI